MVFPEDQESVKPKMATTYPAIWTRSQRGQLSADYESVAFPGNTFIFLQKRKTQQCTYLRCAHCAKAMKVCFIRTLYLYLIGFLASISSKCAQNDYSNCSGNAGGWFFGWSGQSIPSSFLHWWRGRRHQHICRKSPLHLQVFYSI